VSAYAGILLGSARRVSFVVAEARGQVRVMDGAALAGPSVIGNKLPNGSS